MKKIILLIIALSISSSLIAGGFALSGVGAKAIGMGGAFRGLANDFSACYWNPAGLTQLDKTQFNISGVGLYPSLKYNPNLGLPGFKDGEDIENEPKLWLFPNISGFYKVKQESNWIAGIGMFVPCGLGAEWDLWDFPEEVPVPGVGLLPATWDKTLDKNEWSSSIGIFDIHPSFAYQMNNKLSFGFGISIFYGMIEINKLKPHPENGFYIPTHMKLSGTGMGFGANFGILYKPSNKFQVGISGKTPSSIKLNGEAELNTFLNNWYNPYDSTHTNPLNLSSKPDVEATLPMPTDIGIGIAYKLTEKLLITSDVTWTGWSCMDKIELEFDGVNPIGDTLNTSEMVTDWDDIIRFSLGAEYLLNNKLALICGYYFDPTPIPKETITPTLPDFGNMHSANLGVGYKISDKLNIDFEAEYIKIRYREITNLKYSDDGDLENLKGIYTGSIFAFNIGLTYRL